MKIQFNVTQEGVGSFLSDESGEYIICRDVVFPFPVNKDGHKFLITISSSPIKGSKKYTLVKKGEATPEHQGIFYKNDGRILKDIPFMNIFNTLQLLLVPFFKNGRDEQPIYLLAQDA
jgi:hypothetical protein